MEFGKYTVTANWRAIKAIVGAVAVLVSGLVLMGLLGLAVFESGLYTPSTSAPMPIWMKYLQAGVFAFGTVVAIGITLFTLSQWLLNVEVKENGA